MKRIFEEQCEVADDPETVITVRPPRTSDYDGITSPANPEARYNKHKGTGYLVQIMETFVEDDSSSQNKEPAPGSEESEPPKPDLITHVAVDPPTMHDQDALEPAQDHTEARHIKPKALLADLHHGSNECLKRRAQREVECLPHAGHPQRQSFLRDEASLQ